MACAYPSKVEDEELACQVCFEPYSPTHRTPKVLVGCGHTICVLCVKQLWKNRSSHQGVTIRCPFCNSDTRVPPNGLPTNFSLRDVISKFTSVNSNGIHRYCELCEGEISSSSSLLCPNGAIISQNDDSLVDVQAQKEQILKLVRESQHLVIEKLAQIQESSEDLAQIPENIRKVLQQNSIHHFDQINQQLNANARSKLVLAEELEQMGEKAGQICTQLEENCSVAMEAQIQAQQIMDHCLKYFQMSDNVPPGDQLWFARTAATDGTQFHPNASLVTRKEKSILVIGGKRSPKTMEWFHPWYSSENRLLHTRLPSPRTDHISAVLNSGRVLIAGGRHYPDSPPLSSVTLLDPVQETLSPGPSMHTRRIGAASAVADGIVYVCGGSDGREWLSSCERFQSGTWETIAPMTTPRWGSALVLLNGTLYAIGGYNDRRLSLVEAYDTRRNRWTQKSPMPTARYALAAAALGNSIIACGGYISGMGNSNVCERYDVETDCWTSIAPMRKKRSHFGLLTVGNCLMALGGKGRDGTKRSAEIYDSERHKWTLVSPKMLEKRAYHSVVLF